MDGDRFDSVTRLFARSNSTRRSILLKSGGVGFASLLAVLGIDASSPEVAEAKTCQQRCKKRKTAKKRRKW